MYQGNHESIRNQLIRTVENYEESKRIITASELKEYPNSAARLIANIQEKLELPELLWLCHVLAGVYLESYINYWSFNKLSDRYSDDEISELLDGLSLEKKFLIIPRIDNNNITYKTSDVWFKHLKMIISLRNQSVHDMPCKIIRYDEYNEEWVKMGRKGRVVEADYIGRRLITSVDLILAVVR
jgi:hypothetical protein